MTFFQRITLIKLSKPKSESLNSRLQWLGNSLGLFNIRDKDKSCFRMFIELIKSAKHDQSITSDELAYKLNLSRGTVIHHLNKLMEAGIVISANGRYHLRVDKLKGLIDALQKDLDMTCKILKEVADEIDNKL